MKEEIGGWEFSEYEETRMRWEDILVGWVGGIATVVVYINLF